WVVLIARATITVITWKEHDTAYVHYRLHSRPGGYADLVADGLYCVSQLGFAIGVSVVRCPDLRDIRVIGILGYISAIAIIVGKIAVPTRAAVVAAGTGRVVGVCHGSNSRGRGKQG